VSAAASPQPAPQQIVLVGLSGSGKSSTARVLAERLGWQLIDTDDEITKRGKTPAELIVDRGEPAFREIEASIIEEASKQIPAVIATGGGAFGDAHSRRRLGERGYICFLDATPPELARRIRQSSDGVERPMLGEDLEARLYELDRERRPYYNHADLWMPVQVPTAADEAPGEATAPRILRAWAEEGSEALRQDQRLERLGTDAPARVPAAIIDTGEQRTPIWVGPGELNRLAERLAQLKLNGTVFLISDADVMEAHGERVAGVLQEAGIAGASYVVPGGEASKSLRVASELYGWLSEQRAERGDTVVALGGGVVGDLAGYVAATYLRGMPFVQLPTSVLAMNDAAIGGKAAVDLPAGKNLVGAFHQPRAVLADIETLATMPHRALLEGFAEVIKHALILDPELLALLEQHAGELTSTDPDPDLLTQVTARSVRLKALVVSSDPQEQGLRATLNYGHTIGHAIEAITGYREYLHGEAVSIGMMGAARISERMGLISEEIVARQADLLRAFGLPLQASGLSAQAVMDAMLLDKKVQRGRPRFILLQSIGRAVVSDQMEERIVEEAVRGLVSP
jgi:3-dehydroquinate synthase